MTDDTKRLFFAYEITSPWPHHYPKANVIDFQSRHLTLAFLGNISYNKLKNSLNEFPAPSFKTGPVGFFNKCLFLPEQEPLVVTWHVEFFEQANNVSLFQKSLVQWLESHDYILD